MGGKNAIISIQKFPVSIENNTITGLQANGTTTAVIYKDETSKLVTNYSNVNKVTMFHIEAWDIKKNFKNLQVRRDFHYYSLKTLILKFVLTIPTFGYIWALPHEYEIEEIPVYNNDFTPLPGAVFNDLFENTDDSDYSLHITVVNKGDIAINDEFTVVDVLPNFLEFKSVEYLSDGDIKEVAYDLHKNENSQVIPFKIRPFNDGLRPMQSVKIKIHFKPNIQKFKVNKYNPNITTTLPIDKELKPSEANPDSAKDIKVEEKSESKTSPSKDTKIMPADTNDIPKSTSAKEIERKSETKKNSTEEKSTTEEDSSKKTKVEKTKSKGKKK